MILTWIGSLALFGVSVLYVLLACGMPLGAYAMGGKYKVLPRPMRTACAASVLVQWFAIWVLLQRGLVIARALPATSVTVLCYIFAAYLLLNTAMNLLSKSPQEKRVMTPLSLITAVCFLATAIGA